MINPAIAILEEVYDMALNPTQSYAAQLEPLAATGELSNKLKTNEVLFRLCELIDAQIKEIKKLRDDREAIARKLVEFESKLQFDKDGNLKINVPTTDPTQPITSSSL